MRSGTKIKRILLFGGSGQLGSHIVRDWDDLDISSPSSQEVDVTDKKAVQSAIAERAYDTVVNCAAFNQVAACETSSARAFTVNAFAVDHMIQACNARGIRFVTFSTNYVFPGDLGRPYTETDCAHPISAYGTSKLAGELLALRFQGSAFVIRTCGVYGTRASTSKGYTFIDEIIRKAREGDSLRVVSDQIGSPTYTGHLVTALRHLIETERYGLYHMVNSGSVSWFDFATEALRQAGLRYPVEPISSKTLGSLVRRPPYASLENAGIAALGITMPDWRDGIAAYLRDKDQSPSCES